MYKAIATIIIIGCVLAGGGITVADSWDTQPVCTQGQLDKGDTDVNGQCVAPSPQPAPQPVPQPQPAPTPVPAPKPVTQPIVTPQPQYSWGK